MTTRRKVATVAAGALYVVMGVWLLEAVRLVAWPSIVGLLRAYGL